MATTPDQATGMNELRVILQKLGQEWWNVEEGQTDRGRTTDMVVDEAAAALQQLMERCIGQDESIDMSFWPMLQGEDIERYERNKLRKKQHYNLQQAGLLKIRKEDDETIHSKA